MTVFERSERLGFAGQGLVTAGGGVVDVPLRMIGQGYYDALEATCADLGVRTSRARVDCSFALADSTVVPRATRGGFTRT